MALTWQTYVTKILHLHLTSRVVASGIRLLGTLNGNQCLGASSGILLNNETVDVDAYVTDQGLDGLYKMVAREETRIRQDPVARTTDLLQRVFGTLYSRTR